jgi:uncharacterized membrane protein YeaQ/YmgE (transglycosylase-associated protein family)
MTVFGFLILLLIAAICGGIGQSLAGYDLGGCLVSIIVGFIGAYIGLWVAGKMGLPDFFTQCRREAFSGNLGRYRIRNIYICCGTLTARVYRRPLTV